MLLPRSIPIKFIVLVLVQQLTAQEDYGVDESDDTSDHSDFSLDDGEQHEHPDYSKYYSVDESAPQAAQGSTGGEFISPAEFSGFLSPQPIAYEESKKKPIALPPINFIPQQLQQQQTQSRPNFVPVQDITNYYLSNPLRDFFEEAQKKPALAAASENYVKPGPSYISHQLPPYENYDEVKSASRDDVERIPPRPNKPRTPAPETDDEDEGYTNVEKDIEKESASAKYSHELLPNSKSGVDYNTGKSSSTVSQYPGAAGLVLPATSYLTPYQKYSFQPSASPSSAGLNSKYLEAVRPVAPFNPNYKKVTETVVEAQSSDNVPSHLKGQNCRKLSKPASSQSEAMNCFICENAENKSKYTQCSYTSEKEPEEYYQGNSERFSQPAEEDQFRYKRHARRNDDPYYRIRERSRKASDEPSIPADYNSGFNYEPEYYDESQREISYSEKQTEKLKKDPKNCKKVVKDGNTCTICRNPETGGNYEQCSYTSEPKAKKYAYVTEKKYDGNEPEEEKESTQEEDESEAESAQKPVKKPEPELIEDYEGRVEQKSPRKRNDNRSAYKRNYNNDDESYEANKKSSDDNDEKYEIPTLFAGSKKHESRSSDSPRRFDDYHLTLFPELNKEESKQDEENAEYHIPAATKQNVEEVLAEFSKKDRSACKKSEKKGMTCFLCVDKNNIQHEECMFVQESNPKSSHVAYHQLKGAKKLEDDASHPEETKEKPVVSAVKKRRFFKKNQKPTEALETAASDGLEVKVPYEVQQVVARKKRSTKKSNKSEAEPTLKTPSEIDVSDEEGAYSEETRPVYSKVLDTSLPKYMVERTEFEKEFDSASRAF